MSVTFQSHEGFAVCHEKYLQTTYSVVHKENSVLKFRPNKNLFLVKTPYMKDAEARRKVREASEPSTSQALKRKIDRISSENETETKVPFLLG